MPLREYFEARAAALEDLATLTVSEQQDGEVTLRLTPVSKAAVGVVLYLLHDRVGTVALDDRASVPAVLGDAAETDQRAIDLTIDAAVKGRATAFHLGRGGCVEERDATGKLSRTWHNAWPWPGWRRRATRIDYAPYR